MSPGRFPLVVVACLALALSACPDDPPSGTTCPEGWLCFPDGSISDAYLSELINGGTGDTGTNDGAVSDARTDEGPTTDGSTGPDVGADTPGNPDVVIEPGTFGAPCNANVDCLDGWCVEGPEGFVCTKTCQEDCPGGWDCKAVVSGGADINFLCIPRVRKLCTPCQADFQCTGGACLTIEGEQRCAPTCADDTECPDGYSCRSQSPDAPQYCLPNGDSCDCTPQFDGGVRTCSQENTLGTCYGVETCNPGVGWEGCTAIQPSEEVCDGIDNDCNLLVDDGVVEGDPCTNDVDGVGSCAGVTACAGVDGYLCQGPTPEVETCDFEDNDCDGETDEDFKDADGNWTLNDHCGTCGNTCFDKIPNGTGICGGSAASPKCVVDTCDDDYIKINDFQCSLPPDVSCQPCTADTDCYDGSCIPLDGQNVCVSPCGETDQSCNTGYTCGDVGGGVERCIPDTNSCVCNLTTDGQTRTCKLENAFGACFGEETCDAAQGWTGCTALTPAAEICDGIDNNCNGAVDDGVTAPTDPCENTNAFGTCTGTWFCTDQGGTAAVDWWCSASEPADDICDLQDNDCNGEVDDPFKQNGVYVDDNNCGACGISCVGAIPNASASCVENGGQPRCEVVTCDVGYYQASPLTCLPTAESLCAPCETDANCQVPGDVCLSLDGANFCGRDCSDGNLHGLPEDECPPGYGCVDMGSGVKQCQPDSGSCSCLPGDDGNTRNCVADNTFGQCFGQQTCNSTLGWSDCTAQIPSLEVCDGLDNDCDGFEDNVENRGASCENSNADGTCTGILDCIAGGGTDLVCTAAVPAAEVCDYADNNCDGNVDEDFALLYESCSVGTGICQRFGFYECATDGSAEECNAVEATAEAEVCNGLDDNCDGTIDEGFDDLGTICTAGSGACQNTGITVCNATGSGTTCSVSGGTNSPEICDGIDNDCDGQSDEDFPGTGEACIVGLGTCAQPGTIQCNVSQDGTECDAVPLPAGVETCDGLDNDCDGSTDNNLVAEDCALQAGVCAGSTKTCGGLSGFLDCQATEYGATYEPTELTCDGLDNDCDGQADNGLFAPPCALQNGVCAGSTQTCDGANGFVACTATEYGATFNAGDEVGLCDNLDNDCDGQVDEDFAQKGTPCVVGLGACQQVGTYICSGDGSGVVCSVSAGTASPEICDGIDNNCDGQIDNNVTDAPDCALTQGVCNGSTQACVGGVFQACTAADYGAGYQAVEFSCDGLDNDCDGDADLADADVVAPPCANQQGVCNGSAQACGGSSGWQACNTASYTNHSSEYQASNELNQCDGFDNDCDGEVDEDFAAKGSVCTVGQGECTAAGTRVCTADQTGVECSATAGTAQPEVCDSLDNNCDGIVDNAVTAAPDCALTVGVCAGTAQRCISGSFQACTAAEYGSDYEPTEFSCDGEDNDCDGDVDLADSDVVAPPCPLQLGVCNGAQQACGGAAGWQACGTTEYGADYQSGDETGLCDNLDNDCDGEVDEEFANKGQVCNVGVGACAAAGTFICNGAGDATVCSVSAGTPGTEICNGVDDNCDGTVDNAVSGAPACPLTQGVCAGSTQTCVSGSFQACTAAEYGTDYQATEFACDGLDNDCDGDVDLADSDVTAPPCPLQQGVCNGATQACGGGSGWLACGAAQYGATFQSGDEAGLCDGLDNDCDGQVDEDFATLGSPCTVGVGACTAVGTFVCNGAGTGVVCSATAGTPAANETCNGVDDDCDGVVDNNVTGAPACTLTQGVCSGSVQSCISGSFQPCTAAEYGSDYEATEFSCDGLDNDCDGDADLADSDVTAPPCALQQGVCNGASQTCGGAAGWQACGGAQYGSDYQASNEATLCDDLDNDCDGQVDEDFANKGAACSVGTGECNDVGTFVCNGAGTGTVCSASAGTPGTEVCNGLDDNCNGTVDDNVTGAPNCALTQGVCNGSTRSCVSGSFQACTAAEYGSDFEATEFSCDGLDNDCDGDVDLADGDVTAPPCAIQLGVCAGSSQPCGGGSGWQACNAAAYGAHSSDYQASNESGLCDDLDNDCDGLVDEDFTNKGTACSVGVGACNNVGTFVCNGAGSGTTCSATAGTPGTEVCNGIDDNCDNSIDNLTTPLCPLQQGVCGGARQVCAGASGLQACTAGNYGVNFEPSEVSCDGLDNDCDGDVDAADADLPTQACPNQQGVCAGSVQTCSGGSYQACGPADYGAGYEANETTCDNLDNDCDGTVDEGFLNGATGKYDQNDACGNCFTDCTSIFNLPNAFGTCNAVPAAPVCVFNCDPGFYDLNGIPDDGCEFELDTDAIYVSESNGTANASCGLGPAGTVPAANEPCLTIATGIARAQATGRGKVLVASGSYNEQVTMVNTIDLLGGYNPINWGYAPSVNLTVIQGPSGTGHRKTVIAQGITGTTELSGFVIYGANATTAGTNSYAVYIRNSDNSFTVTSNVIYAGDGAGGSRGGNGTDGLDGTDGAGGNDAYEVTPFSGNCAASGNGISNGGGGGARTCGGTSVNGGAGGGATCAPVGDSQGSASNGVTGSNNSGTFGFGGGGGWDGSTFAADNCGLCDLPPSPNTMTGANGSNGRDGTDGNGGNGCSSAAGSVSGNEWVGSSGGAGNNGGHGGGGGGGGAGGGGDADGSFCADDLGGTGGGGGSGACRGDGGSGGSAGGGSFGVFIYNCASPPVVTGNTIFRGNGGQGGDGGNGGGGGIGGDGANGGVAATTGFDFCTGQGGKGGQGGDGGHGGGGGGACGGAAWGIYAAVYGGGSPAYDTNNSFVASGSGGSGGVGGSSLGNNGSGGSTGSAGDASF